MALIPPGLARLFPARFRPSHHRTQLTVYLRLLDRLVPFAYGPTADVSWKGAGPTATAKTAGRK